jgi:hypothetical protein
VRPFTGELPQLDVGDSKVVRHALNVIVTAGAKTRLRMQPSPEGLQRRAAFMSVRHLYLLLLRTAPEGGALPP